MVPLLPLPTTARLFAYVAAGGAFGLRLQTTWWRSRTVRIAALLVLAIPLIGLATWAWGSWQIAPTGVAITWVSIMMLAPFSASLVVSGVARHAGRAVLNRIGIKRDPNRSSRRSGSRLSRRALLEGAAAALPAASILASSGAIVEGARAAKLPLVRMRFADLHPDLDGLRILHLTDLHLGVTLHVKDLERALFRAEREGGGFDLLVLTGDIADDFDELRRALDLVHRHAPRYGVYAALGNHEYLHGIDGALRVFAKGPIPLLRDRGVTLPIGDAKLYLAGADDPEGGASHHHGIAKCRAGSPDDAFRLLLCHRPSGFRIAAEHGFDLTLSGHTHGGQIGFAGRSLFQLVWPSAFLWGDYAIGKSKLYTSSGFGHWFPFRLGCPAEAPIVVLERAA